MKSQVSALVNEGRQVQTLLDAAVRCEQAGPDAKAEALIEWIYELQADENEPDLKVLIFTEFVPTQQMLKAFLEARGISVVTLNGAMELEERKQAQDAFRKSHRVLVSTDAGGEGLNLQFAHVVINYDIPWNPMRLEQRIGRDSVEFRVREVLEQKLAVIFAEFGIDKTGDVLDSAQAGELFEEVFASAILNPDGIETSVDQTVARLRDEIHRVREASTIYGLSDEPDVQAAERLRSHPLPHWVERMTVSYLNAHGGSATRGRSWWDLRWPDGLQQRKCVFSVRERERLTDAKLLNLEDSRIRGLAMNLPQLAAGQPLPRITLAGLPSSIAGLWGLFERGYVSLFLSEDGKLFLPTARHVWDLLQTAEPEINGTLGPSESVIAFERLQQAAEQAGQEVFDVLRQAHLDAVAREEARGSFACAARRKAIERVGLPAVRQYRQSRCDAEESAWREGLATARQTLPEIRPLLLLRVSPVNP